MADAETRTWLARVDTADNRVADLETAGEAAGAGEKTLVLVHEASLPQCVRNDGDRRIVAAWFDADDRAAYLRRRELAHVADVCFAPDHEAAERLALFHGRAFVLPPGQALLDFAIAFGNSRIAARERSAAEARERRLPTPALPADRRPHVLLQVGDFQQGGMELVILDLADTLRARFDCSLLITGQQGLATAEAHRRGISIFTLPAEARETRYRELLHEQRVDLVSAHFSAFGAAAAADLGIPFVQTVHTSWVFLTAAQIGEFRAADGVTAAHACTSGNAALYAHARLGLSVEKSLIMPNGIDPQRLHLADRDDVRCALRAELQLADDDFVYLAVGSIYRDKAQLHLLRALAQVRANEPRAKLVIVGHAMDQAYFELLRSAIEHRDLADAVRFVDFTDDVGRYYAMADAFVLPSFWEGWSLALAEALYAGLPIVATDVGSARDVLPEQGTYIVPAVYDSIADVHLGNLDGIVLGEHPQLEADLAAAMSAVCEHPVRPTLSEAQRRRLEREQAYRAYGHLFTWLLQGGDPRAARAWLR